MENDIKNKSEYISLKEATKYCDYSQEYLSLRARQGKLRAVKIGRNWVTKKEWIEQYLQSLASYYKKKEEVLVKFPEKKFAFSEFKKEKTVLSLKFLLAIIAVLLTGTFLLYLRNAKEPSLQEIREDLRFSKEVIAVFTPEEIQASLVETFKEYGIWLKENSKSLTILTKKRLKKRLFIVKDYLKRLSYFVLSGAEKRKREITEEIQKSKTKEGVVVVPSTSKRAEIREKIKEVFSDKVKIQPKDQVSGIIVPVFRTEKEQEYLYIMVPVTEQDN